MRVAIGSDHRGIQQRGWVAHAIEELGGEVIDLGTHSTESYDYPDIAAEVGQQVGEGRVDRGILICGTGIGVSIAANKCPGVRAAVCHDLHTVAMSRRHNDANVLCLPGDALDQLNAQEMIRLWLSTEFEGGRHQRRIDKITALESQFVK
ncbi:MAG: ribose 5-phosphate isomerase B [Pirellulaceae bacterium]|jgi:ribose 5-phosphate isomerase B|nr:ribose 5-phosphate isomerase B [Pirellulaceae bacterium]